MLKILLIAILTYISSISSVFAQELQMIKMNENHIEGVINGVDIDELEADEQGGLSEQSKNILSQIYQNKQKQRKAEQKNSNVKINHANRKQVNLSGYETISGGTKFDIKVKKPSNRLEKKYELYDKAYSALDSGHIEMAIILYEKILKKYKNDEAALISLASAYHRLGEYELARKFYAKALSLYPNNRNAVNNFLVLVAEEDPEEAFEEFLRLDEVFKNNHVLKAQIAYILATEGKYDAALEYIQDALQISKGNPRYIYNKAVILDNLEIDAEAKKLYLKILETGAYSKIGVSMEQIKTHIAGLKI